MSDVKFEKIINKEFTESEDIVTGIMTELEIKVYNHMVDIQDEARQDATKNIREFYKSHEGYFVDDSGEAYPHKLLFHEMWQAIKADLEEKQCS